MVNESIHRERTRTGQDTPVVLGTTVSVPHQPMVWQAAAQHSSASVLLIGKPGMGTTHALAGWAASLLTQGWQFLEVLRYGRTHNVHLWLTSQGPADLWGCEIPDLWGPEIADAATPSAAWGTAL